jgi:hypothetical protein
VFPLLLFKYYVNFCTTISPFRVCLVQRRGGEGSDFNVGEGRGGNILNYSFVDSIGKIATFYDLPYYL